MSEGQDPQVYAPAIADADETAVLDRFIEASKDIAPSLQVTLAKRYVQPGSNRVLCLAARTTVPLNDNELASVSDLALRLSDGTNVVLSLSVFDESTGASYYQNPFQQPRPAYASNAYAVPRQKPPFFHSYNAYEPYRYEVHVTEKSKLGSFFIISTFLTAVGLLILSKWSPELTVRAQDALRQLPATASSLMQTGHLPAACVPKTTFPVPARAFGKPNESASTDKQALGLKKGASTKALAHAGRPPASRARGQRKSETRQAPSTDRSKGAILVPPPPPAIYTLPPGAPPAMAQFWGFAPAQSVQAPPGAFVKSERHAAPAGTWKGAQKSKMTVITEGDARPPLIQSETKQAGGLPAKIPPLEPQDTAPIANSAHPAGTLKLMPADIEAENGSGRSTAQSDFPLEYHGTAAPLPGSNTPDSDF